MSSLVRREGNNRELLLLWFGSILLFALSYWVRSVVCHFLLELRRIYVIAAILLPQGACLSENGTVADQGEGTQTWTPVEFPNPAVPQDGFSVVWVKSMWWFLWVVEKHLGHCTCFWAWLWDNFRLERRATLNNVDPTTPWAWME